MSQKSIEPDVNLESLIFMDTHLDIIESAFRLQKHICKPISLKDTLYSLKISVSKKSYGYQIKFQIINESGEMINGQRTRANLYIKTKEDPIIIEASYSNHSHKSDKMFEPPIRNISGIMAPYEDALCQYIANLTSSEVHRIPDISIDAKETRFAKNYLNRGYRKVESSSADSLILCKKFEPQ